MLLLPVVAVVVSPLFPLASSGGGAGGFSGIKLGGE